MQANQTLSIQNLKFNKPVMKKLNSISRIILGVSAASMLIALWLPLWQIQLWAPQYPEGLNMKIWHNRLSGAFDIINGLNHYIGMREIRAEMFPEFSYIGILLVAFAVLGVFAAWRGTRRWLYIFTGTAYALGLAALYDFYRWGYDYGHNLDPHAAIVVPGMSYQPPVLGYKNLLNFTAYSGPDLGGWIVVIVGIIASALAFYACCIEDRMHKRKVMKPAMALVILLSVSMLSCSIGPEPIRFGEDGCFNCKMTISDQRFGAEVVSNKGKVYKFDDLNCLNDFLKTDFLPAAEIKHTLAVDFSHPGQLIPAEQAFFLKNEALKSPMRSDVATFSTEADRKKVSGEVGGGTAMSWSEIRKNF